MIFDISVEDIIHRTRKGFFVIDEDTWDEILCFERRGKVYCFLRDKETKRFKRKLNEFYIKVFGSVERCYPGGCRKGKGCSPTNNIHIESHDYDVIKVDYTTIRDMLMDMDETIQRLLEHVEECIDEYSQGMLEVEVVNVEFHSEEYGSYYCCMDRCDFVCREE